MAILLSDSYKVINWDLSTKALDTKYWGKPTDSGRGCKVLLTQNGVAKTPSTETMRINFKKPSGLKVFIDGVISGNYFVFDFPNQVYAEVGEVQAELMLNVSSKFIMSSTFKIKVDPSMTDGIASTSEFDALTDALADVDEVKADIVALENPTFTEASTLANIVSGESFKVLWGKVKKMFSFIGTTTLTTTAQTITTSINELDIAVKSNFLNNTKSIKDVKLSYGNALVTFNSSGVGTITLPYTYNASSIAVCNILGGTLTNSSISGTTLTITSNLVSIQAYVKYNVMGY